MRHLTRHAAASLGHQHLFCWGPQLMRFIGLRTPRKFWPHSSGLLGEPGYQPDHVCNRLLHMDAWLYAPLHSPPPPLWFQCTSVLHFTLRCCSELIMVTIFFVIMGARVLRATLEGMLARQTRSQPLSLMTWWPEEMGREGRRPPSCSNLGVLSGARSKLTHTSHLSHFALYSLVSEYTQPWVCHSLVVTSLLCCLFSTVCVPPCSPQFKLVNGMTEKKLWQLRI